MVNDSEGGSDALRDGMRHYNFCVGWQVKLASTVSESKHGNQGMNGVVEGSQTSLRLPLAHMYWRQDARFVHMAKWRKEERKKLAALFMSIVTTCWLMPSPAAELFDLTGSSWREVKARTCKLLGKASNQPGPQLH